jgi:iron complex outermembrane recepter protein
MFRPHAGCTHSIYAIAITTSSLAFSGAHAQVNGNDTTLEEIIVTAEHRETNLQHTAVAVTAVSGEQLAGQGHSDLSDILRTIPDVASRDELGAQVPTVVIRGVQPSFGTSPTVNIYADGIYQTTGLAPAFDIARVEILKGPQGTLYGRNSLGGVANFINNDPAAEQGGYVALQIGNYDSLRMESAINLPLNDLVQSRTSVYYSRHDGYLSNGNNDQDVRAVRERIRFAPSSDLTLSWTGEYDKWGGHGNNTVPAPLSGGVVQISETNSIARPSDPWYAEGEPGEQQFDRRAMNLKLDWNLHWANLFAQSSYEKNYTISENNAQAAYSFNPFSTPPGYAKTAWGAAETYAINRTQELRLSSPSESSIIWQAGLYLLDTYSNGPLLPRLLAPLEPYTVPAVTSTGPNRSESFGKFGQVTVPINSALRLTAGLRHTSEKSSRNLRAVDTSTMTVLQTNGDSNSGSAWTWKGGFEYDLSADSLLYGDVSRGYKAGGLNAPGSNPLVYKPEYLTAYEFGSKNELFDKQLRLNADVYWYANSNKQFANVTPCTPGNYFGPSFTCNPPIPDVPVINAGKATIYGAELQSAWLVTPDDQLDLTVLYNHTRFDQFLEPVGGPPGTILPAGTILSDGTVLTAPTDVGGGPGATVDRSKYRTQFPNAPQWTETVQYQHTVRMPGGASVGLSGNVQFVSGSDSDVNFWNPDQYQPAYHLYGAHVDYTAAGGKWSVGAYGNNLGNEAVRQRGFVGNRVWLMPPRTFGASLNVNF